MTRLIHRFADVAQADDGSIYVATEAIFEDLTSAYRLKKLNPNGSLVWSSELPQRPCSGPVIADDGSVRVALESGPGMVAFRPDGTLLFDGPFTSAVINQPPIVDPDGVTMLSHAGGATGISISGEELWSIGLSTPPWSGVWAWAAVSSNRMGVFPVNDGTVVGVRDGAQLWKQQRDNGGAVTSSIYDAIAIGVDGTVYAGSRAGFLYAFR